LAKLSAVFQASVYCTTSVKFAARVSVVEPELKFPVTVMV
jgi:hypothetical protein